MSRRTLALLKQNGLVSELGLAGQPVRHEAVRARATNHHIVCSRCGRAVTTHAAELDALQKRLREAPGFHAILCI